MLLDLVLHSSVKGKSFSSSGPQGYRFGEFSADLLDLEDPHETIKDLPKTRLQSRKDTHIDQSGTGVQTHIYP